MFLLDFFYPGIRGRGPAQSGGHLAFVGECMASMSNMS